MDQKPFSALMKSNKAIPKAVTKLIVAMRIGVEKSAERKLTPKTDRKAYPPGSKGPLL